MKNMKRIFLLIAILCMAGCKSDEPIPDVLADFSASIQMIGNCETVTFTDLSTGNPDTWSWTFEGGSPATSTDQNPTVTYPEVGNFDVTLVASNSSKSGSNEKSDFIEVEETIVNDDMILNASQDAVFGKLVPNNNYGSAEDIHLYAWTQGGELNVNRVAISFDLGLIPEGAVLDSAFLSLYYNPTSIYSGVSPNGHSGENSFVVENLSEEWDASVVTWNTQPDATSETQIVVPDSDDPEQDYVNINVSDLIDLVDANSFHGFLLKHQLEEAYKVTFLASSEHPDESLRPTLNVYYHFTEVCL